MSGLLYGFDGDEYLETDPAAIYERWADDHDYDPANMLSADWGRPDKLEILEWSSNSGEEFMPTADRIAEWMMEFYADDCGYESAADQMAGAARSADVLAALNTARDLMLSKVTFLFAQDVLRTLVVTWDADGEPLLDGEPMYRKVAE